MKEFEFEHAERIKRMELELQAKKADYVLHAQQMEYDAFKQGRSFSSFGFNVTQHIIMVPPFNEKEVDRYFAHFECVAISLHWPKDVWTLLLQCVLTGKAQEVYSSLDIEESLEYGVVKTTILRAYELVPEAYRQRFRIHTKSEGQTYVEFAREKENLFERWCRSQDVTTFEQLKALVVLEEFKNCVPETVATYLHEQEAAVLICLDA